MGVSELADRKRTLPSTFIIPSPVSPPESAQIQRRISNNDRIHAVFTKRHFHKPLQIMFVCQISRQTDCRLSSLPDSSKTADFLPQTPIRKETRLPRPSFSSPAPKTSGIYDKITDISKMRKRERRIGRTTTPSTSQKRIQETGSYPPLEEKSCPYAIAITTIKRGMYKLHPSFSAGTYSGKNLPVTVKNTCRASPPHSTSAPGNRTDDAESSPCDDASARTFSASILCGVSAS